MPTPAQDFLRTYGAELATAHSHCERYRRKGHAGSELHSAWELYSAVFGRLTKHINRLTSLDLAAVSPRLLAASNLELAVRAPPHPGQ